jgi:hypothetical protein
MVTSPTLRGKIISSLLKEFTMAEATDSERVVFILCEWTAGTWVYFSIDRFLAGKTLTGMLLAALAILFAIAGVKWPALKLKLGTKFSSLTASVEQVASKRQYRRVIYSAIVVALLVSIGIRVYHYYHRQAAEVPAQPSSSPPLPQSQQPAAPPQATTKDTTTPISATKDQQSRSSTTKKKRIAGFGPTV